MTIYHLISSILLIPRRLLIGLPGLCLLSCVTLHILVDVLHRPLPAYSISLDGDGICAPESLLRHERLARLDTPIDIILRPAHSDPGPVFVHAYKRHAGDTSRLHVLMEKTPDGALRLRGTLRDVLDLPEGAQGEVELIFLLNRSPLPPLRSAAGTDVENVPIRTERVLRSRLMLAPSLR